MPNYAINAVYQPFSFQERMTPLQMMNEEYNKVGEALSELGNDVNQYYRYLDDNSRAIVDDYNNTLDDIATSFSREGLKTVSRNTLFNLKRAYKTQIEPINEAAKSLATMQEQYRELAIKDPTMIITGMPTVSELMSNPNAAPTAVSGAALYKQGTLAASQLPDVSYEQMQRYLEGDTTAIPNIDAIGASIAQMYGTDNEQAYGYIMQGIRDGISARTAEMNSYTQKQNILLQNELDKIKYQTDQQIRLDNVRTANDIRVKTTPSASSSRSGSGSSGSNKTAYYPQGKSTVYWKGEQMYDSDTQKAELTAAQKGTKMQPKTVYELSPENKRRALTLVGVTVPERATEAELDILIAENENLLTPYTYREYIDPDSVGDSRKARRRAENNEFERKPVARFGETQSSPAGLPSAIEEEEEVDENLIRD